MKCPRCKNEVARLTQHVSTAEYPAGLCDTCDAVERAGDKAPLRQGAPPPSPDLLKPTKKCRFCGKEKKPGICQHCGKDGRTFSPKLSDDQKSAVPTTKTKRPYVRRNQALPKPDDPLMTLERLRSQYSDEHAEHKRQIESLEVKLGVLDELEVAIKAAK